MDHKRPGDGIDLLTLCQSEANIAANVWDAFYDSIKRHPHWRPHSAKEPRAVAIPGLADLR